MQTGAITGYIDVAQIALYAFWIFFAGLIFYLRREDKREGYPLLTDNLNKAQTEGWPPMPASKTYLLPHGGTVTTPRDEDPQPTVDAVAVAPWPGAPMQPIGNPLLAGAGPAASALRDDTPDLTWVAGVPRIVPLRSLEDHFLDEASPDPRTMEVVGADGLVGGVVSDLWVDRSEMLVRYLEVTLAAGPSVLVPMPLARIDTKLARVVVQSILGAQFLDAPMLANPDVITLREEDRLAAYFAGGKLYAEPRRVEPLL
jgi:photosynthetic reaction center H subunit